MHKKIHSCLFEFKCKICERSFRHKNSLIVHSRTHSGVKPYKCNYCGNTFADRRTMIIHVRRKHTFKRPYSCKICEKKFCETSSLQRHIKIHKNVEKYTCIICNVQIMHVYLAQHINTKIHTKKINEMIYP